MFFGPEYLENIRKFVEQGGAFLMIGGDLSFAEGGYRGSPIEAILPNKIGSGSISQSSYTIDLTPAGLTHPITSELKLLSGFRGEGLSSIGSVMQNAVVLAKTSSDAPFLAVRDVGKGRTALIATDALWSYNFAEVGKGEGNRSYQEFIRRLTRWLVKDPGLAELALSGIRTQYPEAGAIDFQVHFKGDATHKTVVVTLQNGQGVVVDRQTIRMGKETVYPVEFKNPGQGLYLAKAELLTSGVFQDFVAESFSVSMAGEFGRDENPLPFLKQLASESNGQLLSANLDGQLYKINSPVQTIKRVLSKKIIPLWNDRLTIIGVVLLFALEWFFRKRRGLP